MAFSRLFQLLASVISFYTMVCFVRILLTWIPSAQYSKFGRILASICDPYLNLFRGLRFLRVGMFDLSPAVALCLLIAPHPFWEILRRHTHSRWADFWQPCCILCGRSSHPFWDF